MNPGAIQFTVMPLVATSFAIDLLNPIITSFLKNKSIKILLQKEKILFADDELDITKEILNNSIKNIRRLNLNNMQ